MRTTKNMERVSLLGRLADSMLGVGLRENNMEKGI